MGVSERLFKKSSSFSAEAWIIFLNTITNLIYNRRKALLVKLSAGSSHYISLIHCAVKLLSHYYSNNEICQGMMKCQPASTNKKYIVIFCEISQAETFQITGSVPTLTEN